MNKTTEKVILVLVSMDSMKEAILVAYLVPLYVMDAQSHMKIVMLALNLNID